MAPRMATPKMTGHFRRAGLRTDPSDGMLSFFLLPLFCSAEQRHGPWTQFELRRARCVKPRRKRASTSQPALFRGIKLLIPIALGQCNLQGRGTLSKIEEHQSLTQITTTVDHKRFLLFKPRHFHPFLAWVQQPWMDAPNLDQFLIELL